MKFWKYVKDIKMKFWKYVKDIIQDTSEQETQQQSEQQQSSESKKQSSQSDEQSQENQQQSEQQQSSESQKQSSQNEEQSQENQQQSEQQQSSESQEKSSQSDEQPQESQQQLEQQQSSQSQEQSSQSDEQSQENQQQLEQQQSSQSQEQSSQSDEQPQESQPQSDQQQSSESQEKSSQQSSQSEEQSQELQQEDLTQSLEEQDTLEAKKEKLQQLRDKLKDYADKKKQDDEKSKKDKTHLHEEKKEIEESEEKQYELSEQTNQFLNQLNELPSFEDRDRGAGYSIDTEGYTELPDSMIRTLIAKFLNQRFCKHSTDLNVRSNSLEKSRGFYKWEVKDVITHLETHQITKVFDDKYGYEYANGKNENVPLSFYFDMSGSMSEYTNLLAVIAIELLKKGVKVLIGFNERVNVQIESIKKNIDVQELADILESAGYSNWGWSSGRDCFKKDSRVIFKYIDRNLDNYLLSKKAEKCVVFSDFDPLDEVVNLSQGTEVYWFCFESSFDRSDLRNYNGFIYKVRNARDIVNGLIKVNEKRFETLCYVDNPKTLQRKLGR